MPDFAVARRTMVDSQVRTSDVTDARISAAMLELPRERFVAPGNAELAYADLDPPAAAAKSGEPVRRLLKPMVVARLVQAATVKAEDHVLDLGCATGYSAALLARLARSVVALEQDPALAKLAAENLTAVGAHNVTLVTGTLTRGWPEAAPYDVIFVDGAVEVVPEALYSQLKGSSGRLVAVVGRAPSGRAMVYRSVNGDVSGWPAFDATAPLLPGFAAPPAFVF
jgi:protein-L-isoaspartate(D-aspartate) O-methyltransferase